MSFQAMAWAHQSPARTAESKLILLVLANYAGHDNSCFPPIATLADESLLSEQAIQAGLRELEADGLLLISRQPDETGREPSDLYTLLFDAPVTGERAPHASKPPDVGKWTVPVEFPEGFPKTAEEAVEIGKCGGIPEDFARRVWTDDAGRGGVDYRGNRIGSFHWHLASCWQHKHGGEPASASESILRQRELDRVEKALKELRDMAGRDAMGTLMWNESQRARRRVLEQRRAELIRVLGMTA